MVASKQAHLMMAAFHLGIHGDQGEDTEAIFWLGTEDGHTTAAADTDCTRPACHDSDGDGDPSNDPPLPPPDPNAPWLHDRRDDCGCINAVRVNIEKHAADGAENWLGWQGLGWHPPAEAWIRVRDPRRDNGWAVGPDGNPVCGLAH